MKRISGILNLTAPRRALAGEGWVTRGLICRPHPRSRPRPAGQHEQGSVGWSFAAGTGGIAGIAARVTAGDIIHRWQPRAIEAATRRHPSEEDLLWLEEEVGGSLPEAYRAFLGAHGWTGFSRTLRFPLREAGPFGNSAEILWFLGFSSEIRRDLAYLVSEVFAGQLPEGTIPIGADPHGNLVLLSVVGSTRDRVWFWDRECRGLDDAIDVMVADLEAAGEDTVELDENQVMRRWEDLFPERHIGPAGFGNVYAAADSFLSFVASLY